MRAAMLWLMLVLQTFIENCNPQLTLTSHESPLFDLTPRNITSAERFRRAVTGSTYDELCGLSLISQPLVQLGETIQPGEWPWLAAIFKRTRLGLNFNCGGSLVTSTHVITAAHCVQLPSRPIDPASSLVVALGKHNIFSLGDEENSQSRRVTRIVVNPQYNKPKALDNDLAVLVLSSAVRFTDNVRPVCLWSAQQPPPAIVGAPGMVVGWGKTENGDPVSEEPKKVRMPVVSQEECLLSNQDFAHLISANTFCAGNRNGSGPCTGDSGGGLYVGENFPGRRRWVLRGLVSRSLVLDGDCDLSNYVIFTDIVKFAAWLRETIPQQYFSSSAPTGPPSTISRPTSPSGGSSSGSQLSLVKLGSRDYYFSSELFNKYLNWSDARQFCISHGMQLAVIDTAEKNRLLHTHCRRISTRYSPWLGGTDSGQEGRWVWDPTQQPVRYTNWWTYQPDGGTTENCLYMYADDGKWGDKECDYTKPFICEQRS